MSGNNSPNTTGYPIEDYYNNPNYDDPEMYDQDIALVVTKQDMSNAICDKIAYQEFYKLIKDKHIRFRDLKTYLLMPAPLNINNNEDVIEKLKSYFDTIFYSYNNINIVSETGFYLIEIAAMKDSREIIIMLYEDTWNHAQQTINLFEQMLYEFFYTSECVADVNWAFYSMGEVQTSNIQETLNDTIYDEAYPYLDGIDKYIDSYLNSDEQVLLLKGPPGTGKTRLIRYIMKKIVYRKNKELKKLRTGYRHAYILYTNDEEVLNYDSFYMQFIADNYDLLVLEDIDHNLTKRTEGNTIMAKLLGVSDGILTNVSRKIVLSTNLPSIHGKVDEALLRPGRCFDILEMRLLTHEQASKLFMKLGGNKETFLRNTPSDIDYTLGDVYRYYHRGILKESKIKSNISRTFGFN